MNDYIDAGKIGNHFFKSVVFPFLGSQRKEIHTRPQFGLDTSIINLPGNLEMALTSDPLTLIPSLGLKESAWLSVHLMVNDMATTGVSPMYAQFVLNLPITTRSIDFKEYWMNIHIFCKEIGISITGGHTGLVEGQNSTISGGGTLIAIGKKGTMLSSNNARAGNDIIVTKQTALIATSVLAKSFPETVKINCGEEIYQKANDLFYQTSSLKDGLIAAAFSRQNNNCVTAMHDATEGGVLGAIYEMAVASGCGVNIDSELLPAGKAQLKVCQFFNIDHRYSVGAGSMIIAVKPKYTGLLINKLCRKNIRATCVGKFTNKKDELTINENGVAKSFCPPAKDPYWNAFYMGIKNRLK